MRLFIKARTKALAFEVMQYDAARHVAVLRGVNGLITDNNFHLHMIRRVYELTHDEPDCLRGKGHAVQS